jgi:hypothetical protein
MAVKKNKVWIVEARERGFEWEPIAATAHLKKIDADYECQMQRKHFGNDGEAFRVRKYVRVEPSK